MVSSIQPASPTIRVSITVVDPADTTISDDVVVTVEQGSVTLTASGTGVYYIVKRSRSPAPTQTVTPPISS
jgi:hypothetical protein